MAVKTDTAVLLFLALISVHFATSSDIEDTCMTRALRQAAIHPTAIPRIERSLIQERLDEGIMKSLEYSLMEQTLKNAGVPSWVNRRKIFRCFSTQQQEKANKSCAASICKNGGVCTLDYEAQTHFCQCTSSYYGKHCETRVSEASELLLVKDNVAKLQETVGSTFTRWGHKSCPSTAEEIYRGFTAGSHYTHKGNGANHLCLPFDPEYVPGLATSGWGYIYGAEYEAANNLNIGNRPIQDRSIPCAVCRAHMRGTALMMPARNSCPRGWTREYHGLLMAGHHTHDKQDYICVDRAMEVLPGHPANENGDLLYGVEVGCGVGIDCPPYKAKQPLTCAFCTK